MIKIARGPRPNSLVLNSTSWTNALVAALSSGVKKDIKLAYSRYNQPDVKDALEVAFNGKCGYCESEINSITYGHIEHFRPKSKYPRQTFRWANLLLSCPRCNDKTHKGDQFPLANDDGPLVNPCFEDPNVYFQFDYDPIARIALVRAKDKRGAKTIEIFGLNNRKPLVKKRSRVLRKLMVLKQYENTDPEAKQLIQEAKNPDQEFSAWAKVLL